jgi:hypothetical protein
VRANATLLPPLTNVTQGRHHHLNKAAQSRQTDESPPLFFPRQGPGTKSLIILGPAVGIASRTLLLAPFAPRAVVESDSKGAALGRLAVLAPIVEGHERVSVADAYIGRGGVVEGTVAVSAEAVVV